MKSSGKYAERVIEPNKKWQKYAAVEIVWLLMLIKVHLNNNKRQRGRKSDDNNTHHIVHSRLKIEMKRNQ